MVGSAAPQAPDMVAQALENGDGWLADYLPYQLYRVTILLNSRLQGRLRSAGVNLSQWRVLSVLRADGRLSLSAIVQRTLMEQPSVSRVVAQLEEDGLVDRRTSPEDSRIAEVALTAAGAAAFDEIIPSAYRHQRIALDGLSAGELDTLRAILQRIEQNIDDR